jgi:hypothetical protein
MNELLSTYVGAQAGSFLKDQERNDERQNPMLFLKKEKDGGPNSTVTGYWLIECKPLFSICLLKFKGKSREAFHTHAFNAISWVLKGKLTENFLDGSVKEHRPSVKPIFTPREPHHKVDSDGLTWALTFRGPWKKSWGEFLPDEDKFIRLTNGRKIINEQA